MRNLASIIAAGAAFAALSCSSSSNMTRNGGRPRHCRRRRRQPRAPPAGREPAGPPVARRAGGGKHRGDGRGAAGGNTTTLADPCRGTALPTTGTTCPPGMCARRSPPAWASCDSSRSARTGISGASTPTARSNASATRTATACSRPREIVNWASTGGNGQNVHIDEAGGYLYSGTTAGVRRWMWSNTTDSGGTGQDVLTGQPTRRPRQTHRSRVGRLDVRDVRIERQRHQHQRVRTTTPAQHHQTVQHHHFNGTPFTWGRGARYSSTGSVTCSASTAMRWAACTACRTARTTSLRRHRRSQRQPGEVILRLEAGRTTVTRSASPPSGSTTSRPGRRSLSEIFTGNTRDDAWCQNTTNVARPVTFMQAHAAPMDIVFFTSAAPAGNLPERWRNGAFVSQHGSWNRTPPPVIAWSGCRSPPTGPRRCRPTAAARPPSPTRWSCPAATPAVPGRHLERHGRGNERAPGRRRDLARRRRALHLVRLGRLRLSRRPATMTKKG